MLFPCQDLGVEWWGIGSKLLAWHEKEMSVLTLADSRWATIAYPQFVISASANVIWLIDVNWEWDLTAMIYEALGVTDPVVQIYP